MKRKSYALTLHLLTILQPSNLWKGSELFTKENYLGKAARKREGILARALQ